MNAESTNDLTLGMYRRVYSGFLIGKRINSVSWQAEAWFWRLHALADDFGNLLADAEYLRTHAAPRRKLSAARAKALTEELVKVGLITLYSVGGEAYASIEGFTNIQPAGKNGKRVKKCPFPHRKQGVGGIQVNPGESSYSQKSGVPHKQKQEQKQEQEHQHKQEHAQAIPTPEPGNLPPLPGRVPVLPVGDSPNGSLPLPVTATRARSHHGPQHDARGWTARQGIGSARHVLTRQNVGNPAMTAIADHADFTPALWRRMLEQADRVKPKNQGAYLAGALMKHLGIDLAQSPVEVA